jgi:squalene-hopene/tetraprenyl-beta-curcumene cyclase
MNPCTVPALLVALAVGCSAHARDPAVTIGSADELRPVGAVPHADTRAQARVMIDKAIAYLRTQQNPETGGWRENPDGPSYPAITGLVIDGMLLDPRIDANDPGVAAGVRNILSYAKPDGGIHDGLLPTYNTAICLSALSRVRTPDAAGAIQRGQVFLKGLQYSEDGGGEAGGEPVGPDHPFYGGVGYGRHGRPDLSNLGFFIQALHDTGVSTQDPAYQRALVFLNRVQMVDDVNDMAYADGSDQGGFIYATVPTAESVDGRAGQSMSGTVEETTEDGSTITRLRAYGSMTYVGFKSLIHADLAPGDPRVDAAWRWINEHYTLEENPGMGDQGRYYYYASLARALHAFGSPTVDGRDWRADLIETLAELQNEDGSFRTLHDRWMETDPVLITAYALIALQHAAGASR